MERPLVSICIPTFNRAPQLAKTLESIVTQPEFKAGQAEVVISDNASTDETESIGQQYASQYHNIHYFRNDQNISNENFPLVLSRANGILRKLNNDTLMLRSNALNEMCQLVKKYRDKKPCIFLTNGYRGHNGEELLNFHDFVVREGYHVTWIASFTIWDDECENISRDVEGCELRLWQVKKLYENAYKKDSVVISDFVFGKGQSVPKKNISYGLYQVFYQNYLKLLEPYVSKEAITAADMEIIEKDLLFQFFTNWMIQWELENPSYQYSETENLNECIAQQYKDKPYWNEFQRHYKKKMVRTKIKGIIKTLCNRN